ALGIADDQRAGVATWLRAFRAGLWRLGTALGDHKRRAISNAGTRNGPSFGRIAPRSRHAVADGPRSSGLLGGQRGNADGVGGSRPIYDHQGCTGNLGTSSSF